VGDVARPLSIDREDSAVTDRACTQRSKCRYSRVQYSSHTFARTGKSRMPTHDTLAIDATTERIEHVVDTLRT
jgi:hypothetical protein